MVLAYKSGDLGQGMGVLLHPGDGLSELGFS